jgi:3-deoxy-7-phosphoheptulonate synthase
MILVLKPHSAPKDVDDLIKTLEAQGFTIHRSDGANHTILGLVGDTSRIDGETYKANHLIDTVMRVSSPYKMASRAFHPNDTLIKTGLAAGEVTGAIGGGSVTIIAGPCSVETKEQIVSVARDVKRSGARLLRGGAFKPRTSPYSFQGLGGEGL